MGIFSSLKKILAGGPSSTPAPTTPEGRLSFYLDSIEFQRSLKDRDFRSNPHSPIDDRVNFEGLHYYPPDPAYRFSLPLQRAAEPQDLQLATSTGDHQPFKRLGTIEFQIEGQPATLAVYQSLDHDGLFLPFRDATSGVETYGAGRYLEPEILASSDLLVDFNLAYNPYCAYSDQFSCPLPPLENQLTGVAIRAGEKMYKTP
jgi:hypothetical protein